MGEVEREREWGWGWGRERDRVEYSSRNTVKLIIIILATISVRCLDLCIL